MSEPQIELLAVSPIDGRYKRSTKVLSEYFSEYAWIKGRVYVEVEYLLALSKVIPQMSSLTDEHAVTLRTLAEKFTVENAERVKALETVLNHDVKAVEYFLKESCAGVIPEELLEFIHFGITSQDINNTSIPRLLKGCTEKVYMPSLQKVLDKLDEMATQWKGIPMLARTHGQAATPTTMGKELKVFVERLTRQVAMLNKIPYTGKLGGATGGFNSHHVSYPGIDWLAFADKFVESLGLERQQFTTQIEHYDDIASLMDAMKRINIILLDLSKDIWQYVSLHYFKQTINPKEVGSSAMPHKVNPIDFENAEGNLGIANALFDHMASKLPISRLQRDLTDSTVLRNLGVPIGHTLIALGSLCRGLGKLKINEQALEEDLDANWAVCSEAIQTILRRENFPQPYETLKELTRTHHEITKESLHAFIVNLNISDQLKNELLAITPFNYVGVYPKSL